MRTIGQSLKILVVFDTRPESIKIAPIVDRLKCSKARRACLRNLTAQHRERLDQIRWLFDIVPEVDLDIVKLGRT